MSATPIPRSLALILYGDLDISVIKELPAGRVPVSTRLVPESKREDMYGFLRKEVQKGRQAYIVCPMVEDSEQGDELRSAKSVFKSLQESMLKDLRIALTWGNQKSTEKDQILRDFKEGKYDILVSTTVIEVGINNPNATIMVVENAERFGLSQLHQLRGRVGRGTEQSWCFLLSDHSEKLQILCKTNDGFEISRKDLEIRGPGDLLGTRQSGEADLHSVFSGDSLLIEEVSDAVKRLHQDPGQKDILKMLEEYANSYFACTEREIALN
jgi:ATP-dependent DNA helicase RecG